MSIEIILQLKAENARLRAELAEAQIVSARLTAWTEGYGGVDIALAGGRRVALWLGAPHGDVDPTLRVARESRLGPGAHLGKLPDKLFSVMMDGAPREVSDLIRLVGTESTRKQVYNALGYLSRRGYVERLRYGTYRAISAASASDERAKREDPKGLSPQGASAVTEGQAPR